MPSATAPPDSAPDAGRRSWFHPAALAGAALAATLAVGTGALVTSAKFALVLPLVVGAGVLLGVVAITRFELYVMTMLVVRASLDLTKLSGRIAGKAGLRGPSARALDPSSLLAVLFLLAAALWLAAQYRRHGSVPGSGLRRSLLLFFVASALSVLGSDNPAASLLEAMRICAVVVMFVVVERLSSDPAKMRQVLKAVLLSAVFPIAFTLAGFLTGHPRTEQKGGFTRIVGTFNQSNDFGRYLMLMVIMAVALYPYVGRRWKRPLGLAVAVMSVLLVLTYTRSAVLATALGLLVVGVLQSKRLLAGLVVAAALALLLVPSFAGRFTDLSGRESKQVVRTGTPNAGNTLTWRLDYWSEVLPLANENPVTGIGLTMTKYNTDEAKQPHNDFVRVYVETGLIGLGTYLAMLVALVVTGRRAVGVSPPGSLDRGVSVGFLACTVAFIAVSTVANVISNVVNLWYFFALAAAASAVVRRHRQTASLTPSTVAAAGTVHKL